VTPPLLLESLDEPDEDVPDDELPPDEANKKFAKLETDGTESG
jgi:hypothetical protein